MNAALKHCACGLFVLLSMIAFSSMCRSYIFTCPVRFRLHTRRAFTLNATRSSVSFPIFRPRKSQMYTSADMAMNFRSWSMGRSFSASLSREDSSSSNNPPTLCRHFSQSLDPVMLVAGSSYPMG